MHMPLVLTNRRRRGGSASAPAFSPSTLYSSGSQGIWLDPSDLSTMFSDRAGTTPVTTPGTVVGLRLDKSKGLTLGAELVVNGDFSNGTTGWTAQAGTTLSVASGVASVSGANPSYAGQSFTTVVGRTYKVTATLKASPALAGFGGIRKADGPTNSSNIVDIITSNAATSTDQTRTVYFSATSTTTWINIQSNSFGTVNADDFSVRELPGNHAVASTDAARPTYGVEPKGGRRNLLTWSEDFGNAIWVKNGAITVPATQYLAPDGTTTAESLVFTGNANDAAQQDLTGLAPVLGVTFTFSLWLRCASGTTTLRIGITQPSVLDYVTVVTVTTDWQRFTFSQAFGSAGTSARVRVLNNAAGTSGTVFAWGAQLELGSTATAYQRVLSAYDITESGVATTHYVQFDGSDDSMSTAAIDFTGTDKMSVFAGVRKLSDVSNQIVAELSATINSNNGSFYLLAPGGTNTYASAFKGTTAASASTAGTYAPPITNLVSTFGDISGDSAILRVNGIQAASSTSDQGTGNFGNYSMFFGRRGNSSLSFNGRDFGIIIVGKAASAGEITDTETWLAARTSGVTL